MGTKQSSKKQKSTVSRRTGALEMSQDGRRPAKAPATGQTGPGQAASELVRVTLDEFNLATFPISVLDKKAQSSREPLSFHDNVVLNGERIERMWKVFPHPEKGFPGPIDDDVLMALLELTREQGGAKKVYFSRYDLLKRLGWSINATYYQRLETSFKKLAAVRVEAINAFGDQNKKRFVNMGLTFIQEWKLNAETRGGERSSYVLWSDRIADSIHQKLTRYLDATFYFEELTSPIERRLFRHLDNHFDGKHQMLTLNVRDLSHEHLGISRHYKYVSQIRQRLEPALNLFVDKGYLESWLLSGDNLHVYRKPNFISRVQLALPFLAVCEPPPATDGETDTASLERLLVERGVAPSVAARLCGPEDPEQRARLERAIGYFDAEIAAGKQFANPGGFLVSLVAKGAPGDTRIGAGDKLPTRGKVADRASSSATPKPAPDMFEVEFAYQGYLNDLGLRHDNELTERERERLIDAKRRELLESTHRSTFKKMPSAAFDEHVRYMVRKDLSLRFAEPFDTWRATWEEKRPKASAG
jgi:plasmid replication initiation protein